MAQKHWQPQDFVITSTYLDPGAESGADRAYGCQQGYCRKCSSDMQRFYDGVRNGAIVWGPLRHYNSHKHVNGR